MSEVIELTSVSELEDQRLLWSSLLAQTQGASFFQSLDWLICYWNHFGDGQRLRVLVVMSQGAPIGILPLIVRRESTRAGPLRVLTYPLHDWGSYYGPIGPHPSATLLAGLGYVRHQPVEDVRSRFYSPATGCTSSTGCPGCCCSSTGGPPALSTSRYPAQKNG